MEPTPLPFPRSLPEFQRLFPDDAACCAYVERLRWPDGFACSKCDERGEPWRDRMKPLVLQCRVCRAKTSLVAGTVMERTHSPLLTWFWGAYLVSSQKVGMSASNFQRQIGVGRYETAFQILHKLRAGMVRPNVDRIGGVGVEVEMDETLVGGATRGEGKGVHHKVYVVGAIEVRRRPSVVAGVEPTKSEMRRGGTYAGRLRLRVVPDRKTETLLAFAKESIAQGSHITTDDWGGYDRLATEGYEHLAVPERNDPEVAERFLPLIHLEFSNLKAWLIGTHHGVSSTHLQAYLNEFAFRFNRRFYPFNSFRSLLGIGVMSASATTSFTRTTGSTP